MSRNMTTGTEFDPRLWHGERPERVPPHKLMNMKTGATVDHPVYVLTAVNFERAEEAIALCMAHGLLLPTAK